MMLVNQHGQFRPLDSRQIGRAIRNDLSLTVGAMDQSEALPDDVFVDSSIGVFAMTCSF